MLVGNVFVTNNATLTIEPGTVIIGDYDTKASLTISRGATIIADGLETDPIVFTSNRSIKRAGDWGGLIVLGDAPTSKFGNGSVASFYSTLDSSNYGSTNFGGENSSSCSGILRYVRIEYAGKRIKCGQLRGNRRPLFSRLGGPGVFKTECILAEFHLRAGTISALKGQPIPYLIVISSHGHHGHHGHRPPSL